MQVNFGCHLDVLLFEPMNTSMLNYIQDLIAKSILYHEPRIDLQNIDLGIDQLNEGLVTIKLDYIVRSTNSRFNGYATND